MRQDGFDSHFFDLIVILKCVFPFLFLSTNEHINFFALVFRTHMHALKHSGDDLPARHSIAFFCNPNKSTTVQALPGTGAPKHAPINAFDYLIGRLNATI